MILIVFFLRDGSTESSHGSFFTPIREELEERDESSFYYKHSYFFRVIQEYRDRLYLSRRYSQKINESYFGNSEQTREWQKAKDNLMQIKDIGERINAEVALVVFPILVELNPGYPFTQVCEAIAKFGSENGLPTHNLLPAFMGEFGPDLWVSAFNQHPNSKGHEIASNSILPFLRQLL